LLRSEKRAQREGSADQPNPCLAKHARTRSRYDGHDFLCSRAMRPVGGRGRSKRRRSDCHRCFCPCLRSAQPTRCRGDCASEFRCVAEHLNITRSRALTRPLFRYFHSDELETPASCRLSRRSARSGSSPHISHCPPSAANARGAEQRRGRQVRRKAEWPLHPAPKDGPAARASREAPARAFAL
jgi:hypothetical protein